MKFGIMNTQKQLLINFIFLIVDLTKIKVKYKNILNIYEATVLTITTQAY